MDQNAPWQTNSKAPSHEVEKDKPRYVLLHYEFGIAFVVNLLWLGGSTKTQIFDETTEAMTWNGGPSLHPPKSMGANSCLLLYKSPPHLRKTRKSSLFLEHKELISCQESSSPELADISGERSMVCSCLMSTKLQIFFCSMEKNSQLLLRYNGPDLSREIERSDAAKDVFLKRSSDNTTTGTEQGPSYKSP